MNHCDVIRTRRFHESVIIACGVAWLCAGQTTMFPKGIATNIRSEHATRLHVVNKIEDQTLNMLPHRSKFVETLVPADQTVEEHDTSLRRPENLINFCSRLAYPNKLNGGDT